MRSRRYLLVAAALVATACGLTAVGEMVSDPSEDGGGPSADGGGETSTIDGDVEAEAGDEPDPVAYAKCIAACDGGCNDAGACTLSCLQNDACRQSIVVCPPGIPCNVNCEGMNSCDLGIDCMAASSCNIRCIGPDSCDGPITCGGSKCNVACTGGGASCEPGVFCDAGSCDITCDKDDCQFGPVACNAQDCRIKCGNDAGAAAGDDSCAMGVACNARDCDLECAGTRVCRNGVSIRARRNASVFCSGQDTCDDGMSVTAGDASIVCRGDPVECTLGGLTCDGGNCHFACIDTNAMPSNVSVCCKAGVCDAGPNTNCNVTFECP